MSSKMGSSYTNDRRLKLLYESLDNNENKRTIQEADKVLRKNPNLFTAKALKALALTRLSRREEAESILSQLESLKELEDNTIYALTACYKELHHYEAIVKLYEKVCAKGASEEELAHLFMAYLRVEDYGNLQKVAIKMHKLNPDNNYPYWNIASYLLQALKDPVSGQKLYLKMAQSWAVKCQNENKINTLSEVMLYGMVLEKMQKWPELLQLLTTSLGEVVKREDVVVYNRSMMRVLAKNHNWSRAAHFARDFLSQNPDDLLAYQYLLRVHHHAFKLHHYEQQLEEVRVIIQQHLDHPDKLAEQPADQSLTFASFAVLTCAFVNSTRSDAGVTRGPLLAQLELLLFLKYACARRPYSLLGGVQEEEEEDSDGDVGGGDNIEDAASKPDQKSQELWQEKLAPLLLKLLVRYASRVGGKPCCLSDLRRLLTHLSPQHTTTLLQSLRKELSFDEEDGHANNIPLITSESSMWKHQLFTSMTHYLRHPSPFSMATTAQTAASDALPKYFEHALTFGTHLNKTEPQPAEGYILIHTQELLRLHYNDDDGRLLEAVVELEGALEVSPCSHSIKITLILLYSMLGNTDKMYSLFNSMDVKFIQLDSIGYLLSNGLSLNGDTHLASLFHYSVLEFFETAPHDLVNHLVMCFKWRNYHKTEELLDFKHRLEYSVQFFSSTTASRLLSILSSLHHFEDLCKHASSLPHPLPLKRVANNRDVNLLLHLLTLNGDGVKKELEDEWSYWLLMQSRLLSFLCSSVKQTELLLKPSKDVEVLRNGKEADEKETKKETKEETKKETKEKVDLGDYVLFKQPGALDDFDSIVSRACNFERGKQFRSLLPTPLSHFISMGLHSSLIQFSSLHQSIINVAQNPNLDSTVQKTRLQDLQIHKLLDSMPQQHETLGASQRFYLLVQHCGQLLVVLQCCSQLLTPFKAKKSKKNKTPAIPTTAYNFDLHAHAVSNLLHLLSRHFSPQGSPLTKCHDLEASTEKKVKGKNEKVKDEKKKEAVLKSIFCNRVKLHKQTLEQLTQWTSFLQSCSNANFTPQDVEGLAKKVGAGLVL